MSRRAKTKKELLESIQSTRASLEKKFSKLTPGQMVWPGSMGEWSVKDILAHLVDWEQRFIEWYQAGKKREIPKTPARFLISHFYAVHILLDSVWAVPSMCTQVLGFSGFPFFSLPGTIR